MTLVELANQPTQEQILEKVENIDLYSGTTVNADGKKLVPITQDALVPKLMVSEMGNQITSGAVWDNYLFQKVQSSLTAYLYNKTTGETTTITFGTTNGDIIRNLQPVLGNYMQMGKYMCNDGFAIIEDPEVGPVLLYTGVYSGGSSWAVQIELNRVKGRAITYDLNDMQVDLPGWTSTAPKVCQTRKYVLFHRNNSWTDFILRNKKMDPNKVINPIKRVSWYPGVTINGATIHTVYRLSDAMLEDQDVMLMVGATGTSSPINGFVAHVNITTKQVLAFSMLPSVSAAQNLGEAPVYQNDNGIQIYTGGTPATSVTFFNRKTLEYRVLYNMYAYNFGHMISVDNESIVLEEASHQASLGADKGSNTIRMRRERIFFDGRIREVLPVGTMPLEYLASTLNTGGQISAMICWNGDKYIQAYGVGNAYIGLYTAEWDQIITSYKEVIE